MSDPGPQKSLRDEMGDGYLSLLDSVRHSFEQAAWGQEGGGNLADDFYPWAGPTEAAPAVIEAAEPGGAAEVRAAQPEPMAPADHDWNEFAAWIDGKREAADERGREGLGLEGPELGE